MHGKQEIINSFLKIQVKVKQFWWKFSTTIFKIFSYSIEIPTHAMPYYCRYCSIAISEAAGEKRSHNHSKTQKLSLHNLSSPLLKQEERSPRSTWSSATISFPSSCWSSSLTSTSGIVFAAIFKMAASYMRLVLTAAQHSLKPDNTIVQFVFLWELLEHYSVIAQSCAPIAASLCMAVPSPSRWARGCTLANCHKDRVTMECTSARNASMFYDPSTRDGPR